MASSVDTNLGSDTRLAASRRWLAAGVALGLAVAAGGGAIWLLSMEHARPWDEAFGNLSSTSEICRVEGDATAHRAARVSRSHGQLDRFVRQRFDQFAAEARLAQDQYAREAQSRAASQPASAPVSAAARLSAQLSELVGERERLLERFTPQHPMISQLDQQIADLDRQRAGFSLQEVPSISDPSAATPAADLSPAAAWQKLVEHSVVEYDQLAASCRHAEKEFDEAQMAQSTALDGNAAAVERWIAAAAEWGELFAVPAAIGSSLWAVACAAIGVLGWLLARGTVARVWPGRDRLITSVEQIERWFSLPAVTISAADEETTVVRRPAPRWLVLPAQFAFAFAVFCLVATTIQNPSWIGHLLAR